MGSTKSGLAPRWFGLAGVLLAAIGALGCNKAIVSFDSNDLEVVSVFWPGALVRGMSQQFQVSPLLQDDADPDAQEDYSYRDKLGAGDVPFRYLDSGNAAVDQANMDYILEKYRDGGVTVLAFDWYMNPDLVLVSGALDNRQFLTRPFDLYIASTVPNKPKFCFVNISGQAAYDVNTTLVKLPPLAPTGGTWLNFTSVFLPYWIPFTQHEMHWKTSDGRPIMFLFDSAGPAWDQTRVNELRAALFNRGVIYGNTNLMVTTLGLDGVFFYGPNQTSFGVAHRPYSDQIAKDIEFWTLNGANETIPAVTVKNDGRPRIDVGDPGNWVDCPTYEQIEGHVSNAIQFAKVYSPLQAIWFHPAEEPDESGDILPTEQSIVRSPNAGLSPWLAALINVKTDNLPPVYENHYHPNWLNSHIATVGAGWSLQQGSTVYGAFEYAESRTSTAANSKTFTSGANCTRLMLKGRKGAGVGTGSLVLDGGAPQIITQTDATTQLNVLLFDSGPLAAGVHTLAYTRNTGLIAIDEFVEEITR